MDSKHTGFARLFLLHLSSDCSSFRLLPTIESKPGVVHLSRNFRFFGHAGSFSPLTLVTTVLAITVRLWWEAIDDTCRTLQPFLPMSYATRSLSRGLNLSYTTSSWIWASSKASRKKDWLLSLVTFTTLLLQIRKLLVGL